jgi:hypothetical protein
MSFFTTRERAELGKSAEIRVEGKVRESVRRDFAPRRRPADNDLAGHVGSVMRRVAESSLQEIDDLIVVLQGRREELLSESARVQREIIEYAKLSQSTMQSTKIITDSLSYLNKVPGAPRMSEFHLEDISNEAHRDSGAEAFARHSENQGTLDGQAEVTAVPARTSETTPGAPA